MISSRLVLAATIALPLQAGTTVSAAVQGAIPAMLQPVGYRRLFSCQATGVQIYMSVAEASTPFKWVLKAPLAELSCPQAKLTIYHYGRPSWVAADGSEIMRDVATPVKSVPASNPTEDIPWLLIKVTADPAAGALSKVGFVERVSTHGGTAPSTPPVRAGINVGVPYTATYAFYVKE
jgi:hypothetical protein